MPALCHSCVYSRLSAGLSCSIHHRARHSFPTRRSSDLLPDGGARVLERRIHVATEILGDGPREIVARVPATALEQVGAAADRKSTRLNSSHLGISYAVFCLNKKKGRV